MIQCKKQDILNVIIVELKGYWNDTKMILMGC